MELSNLKDIELSDKGVKLKFITKDSWVFVSPEVDFVNEVTGIMISSDGYIHVKYLGGDFEGESTHFIFKYDPEALDEVWYYHFNEDYPNTLDIEKDDLGWVSEISSLFYTLLNDEWYVSKQGNTEYYSFA